jgi:hypothetical protein
MSQMELSGERKRARGYVVGCSVASELYCLETVHAIMILHGLLLSACLGYLVDPRLESRRVCVHVWPSLMTAVRWARQSLLAS